jgi:hypothetical protein
MICVLNIFIFSFYNFFSKEYISFDYIDNSVNVSVYNLKNESNEYEEYLRRNYFNGESKEEIARKINRYLNSTLKGKGEYIVEYSLSVGMDPYLASAVMLQETGCAWTCSYLTRVCNNVGGNKGKPSCNNGSYKRFSSIEDGIRFAIDKLNSYYKKGYTTAKEINPFYAGDKTWYVKVNNYISKLKK